MDDSDSKTRTCPCGEPLEQCDLYGIVPDSMLLSGARGDEPEMATQTPPTEPVRINVMSSLDLSPEILEYLRASVDEFVARHGRHGDTVNARFTLYHYMGPGFVLSWLEPPLTRDDYPLQKPYTGARMMAPDTGALRRWLSDSIDRPREDHERLFMERFGLPMSSLLDLFTALGGGFGGPPIGVPFGPPDLGMTGPGGIPFEVLGLDPLLADLFGQRDEGDERLSI